VQAKTNQAAPIPIDAPRTIDIALSHLLAVSISPRCWPSENLATREPIKMMMNSLGVYNLNEEM
jgi:hypothetical protein